VLIRPYTDADLSALRRLHETQGFDYAFPDLCNPLFLSKLVVEDDAGRAVMASLARLTCEIYLLMDPAAGTPRDRFARIAALQRAGEADLRTRGLEDAHAWLPPRIAARFGRRIAQLGWLCDDSWTPYCRRFSM
jgi:hypothetical protein